MLKKLYGHYDSKAGQMDDRVIFSWDRDLTRPDDLRKAYCSVVLYTPEAYVKGDAVFLHVRNHTEALMAVRGLKDHLMRRFILGDVSPIKHGIESILEKGALRMTEEISRPVEGTVRSALDRLVGMNF